MITIKKARPDDAKEMQNVFYSTWLDTYPNEDLGITKNDIHEMYREKLSDNYIEKLKEKILNLSNKSAFLIAEEENKIIGVCKIKTDDEINELGAIYVLPKHQRKGVGQLLWYESLKFFNNKGVKVCVASYNEKAINFYRKLGFTIFNEDVKSDFVLPSGVSIPEIEMRLVQSDKLK